MAFQGLSHRFCSQVSHWQLSDIRQIGLVSTVAVAVAGALLISLPAGCALGLGSAALWAVPYFERRSVENVVHDLQLSEVKSAKITSLLLTIPKEERSYLLEQVHLLQMPDSDKAKAAKCLIKGKISNQDKAKLVKCANDLPLLEDEERLDALKTLQKLHSSGSDISQLADRVDFPFVNPLNVLSLLKKIKDPKDRDELLYWLKDSRIADYQRTNVLDFLSHEVKRKERNELLYWLNDSRIPRCQRAEILNFLAHLGTRTKDRIELIKLTATLDISDDHPRLKLLKLLRNLQVSGSDINQLVELANHFRVDSSQRLDILSLLSEIRKPEKRVELINLLNSDRILNDQRLPFLKFLVYQVEKTEDRIQLVKLTTTLDISDDHSRLKLLELLRSLQVSGSDINQLVELANHFRVDSSQRLEVLKLLIEQPLSDCEALLDQVNSFQSLEGVEILHALLGKGKANRAELVELGHALNVLDRERPAALKALTGTQASMEEYAAILEIIKQFPTEKGLNTLYEFIKLSERFVFLGEKRVDLLKALGKVEWSDAECARIGFIGKAVEVLLLSSSQSRKEMPGIEDPAPLLELAESLSISQTQKLEAINKLARLPVSHEERLELVQRVNRMPMKSEYRVEMLEELAKISVGVRPDIVRALNNTIVQSLNEVQMMKLINDLHIPDEEKSIALRGLGQFRGTYEERSSLIQLVNNLRVSDHDRLTILPRFAKRSQEDCISLVKFANTLKVDVLPLSVVTLLTNIYPNYALLTLANELHVANDKRCVALIKLQKIFEDSGSMEGEKLVHLVNELHPDFDEEKGASSSAFETFSFLADMGLETMREISRFSQKEDKLAALNLLMREPLKAKKIVPLLEDLPDADRLKVLRRLLEPRLEKIIASLPEEPGDGKSQKEFLQPLCLFLANYPEKEGDEILELANTLSFDLKLLPKALWLLAKLSGSMEREEAVSFLNHFSDPKNQKEAFELFELLCSNPGLQAQVESLLNSNSSFSQAFAICKGLVCFSDPQERDAYRMYIADLCGKIDSDQKIKVMEKTLEISWENRRDLIHRLLQIRERYHIGVSDSLEFFPSITRLDEELWSVSLSLADSLIIKRGVDAEEKMEILLKIVKIPGELQTLCNDFQEPPPKTLERWKLVEQFAKPWMSREDIRAIFLYSKTTLRIDAFVYCLREAERLLEPGQPVQPLIYALLSIPESDREPFSKMSERDRREVLHLNQGHTGRQDAKTFIKWGNEEKERYFELGSKRALCFELSQEEQRTFLQLSLSERKKAIRGVEIKMAQQEATEEELFLVSLEQTGRPPNWETTQLMEVEENELKQYPHRFLLSYLAKKQAIGNPPLNAPHAFPTLAFVQQIVGQVHSVDVGGVSRNFASLLFDHLCCPEQKRLPMRIDQGKYTPEIADPNHPGSLSQEDRDLLPPAAFGTLSKERQISCYQGIGVLFALILHRFGTNQQITAGIHLHPIVFEMLHALNVADFLPANASSTREKILSSYLKHNYPEWFGSHANDAALQQEVSDLMKGEVSARLKNLEESLEISAMDLVEESAGILDAMMEITKALTFHLPNFVNRWMDLKGASADELRERIEGVFEIEELLKALDPLEPEPNADLNLRQWMKDWIQETWDKNPEKIQLFISAISGSNTWPRGQKIDLQFFDPLPHQRENVPEFHSCFWGMTMPRYSSPEKLKERLETALQKYKEGADAGASFQGLI